MEVFGVRGRFLERVAFRDFIVVLDFDDFDVGIESHTLFLDRPFVENELGVFLARDGDGSEGIARVIVLIVLEFSGCDVVDGAVFVGKRMGATHFGRFCFIREFASIVNSGEGVLMAFLIDDFKKMRDDGRFLLGSQGRAVAEG